jgi:pimeloyl-ACP methyl ester carboxylesterase/predicted glycosyltransferase
MAVTDVGLGSAELWPLGGGKMRSRGPDSDGYVQRDGVRVFYEVYGSGRATILMLPTWSVLPSAHGRFQMVDLSRHYRVVTFDGRGNGRSDRPKGRDAYAGEEFVKDAVAVLDATGTDRAVVVACSLATHWLLRLAADHPDRVLGAVASGTNLPLAPPHDRPKAGPIDQPSRSREGWAKFDADYWRTNYEDFLRFFFSQVWTEPHSEKLIDACVAWGQETTPETLIDTIGTNRMTAEEAIALIRRTRCPWLVIHGDGDELQPHERAVRLADEAHGSLVTLEGAGHCSGNRDPVRFNLLIREFTEQLLPWRPSRRTWTRAQGRPRSVLIVPGGEGIGTVRRDLKIAAALRGRFPNLRVEWLAPEPVRTMLVGHGEAIHPASASLPTLAEHLEHSAGEYELDAFAAWRDSDEVHFLDFTIFNDLVTDEPFDLVVADNAWGLDHHLHENPELKHFAYAWLTDVIGWLPEADADDRRRYLMADANAEMLEQVERYPRIRDRAICVGELEDLPDRSFGDELPGIREWARDRFTWTGPISGFGPGELNDRASLRRRLGYEPGERVCLVTAGATAVGRGLIERCLEAAPDLEARVPRLRVVVAVGPRIDPSTLQAPASVELHGYLPDLHLHLAAADVAVVGGGGTTTLELLAAGRPFAWFPLRRHTIQREHVAHRIKRYGGPPPMEFGDTSAKALASAIASLLSAPADYRAIPEDNVDRAADPLAELL